MAQWWEHSPPTNVGWVRLPVSVSYVGWVCCWFSSLLREVFLWVLRLSPLLKNQHLQIPIRSSVSPIRSALVHGYKIETIIKLFDFVFCFACISKGVCLQCQVIYQDIWCILGADYRLRLLDWLRLAQIVWRLSSAYSRGISQSSKQKFPSKNMVPRYKNDLKPTADYCQDITL